MLAVLAALLVLALLVLLAGLYVRCRLSVLLWYRNRYGELEINGEPAGNSLPRARGSPRAEPSPALQPPFPRGSPQTGSCTTPTSPTPPPRMTESSSTSS